MAGNHRVFETDNTFQLAKRDRYLKPFYQKRSEEGRFVFMDKGNLATILQREFAVDTIMQKAGGLAIGVEEKIVRWPGHEYTAFVLETWSCTVPGHERQGWMRTARCDFLLYAFEQQDGSLKVYVIPFRELQTWFFANDHHLTYSPTRTKQINRTECRVVPIADVLANVRCLGPLSLPRVTDTELTCEEYS